MCGVDFVYYGNPSPEHYMTEQNGGGVAVFDFDGDGWQDLFFSNGDHVDRPAAATQSSHHLYRNRTSRNGTLAFENIASSAGVAETGFGMGVVAGDYDNDGFPDLLVCYYGKVQLWRNNGDGTFEDVTSQSSIIENVWSASGAFADLDDDGDLDLYVTNYVDYSFSDPPCFLGTTERIPISCSPMERAALADRLWENLGDGTFRDSSRSAGIHDVVAGKGLAVEIVDLNNDGHLDIYVANDTTENFLFVNEGSLKFSEKANVLGVAVGQKGTPESSMGIGCADFDRDGRFDLFVTNFANAINDFYLNVTESGFLHASASYGLDLPSRPMLAFGAIAEDFDLDTWPDLFVANGHIWDLRTAENDYEYEMTPQLFRNVSGKKFQDDSQRAGEYFLKKWLGRSAARGDLDNDGTTDLVISQQLQPAAVLRNTSDISGQSVTVRLIGRSAAREPQGVRLIVQLGEKTFHHKLQSGGSFQSSSASETIIATGSGDAPLTIDVVWSSVHRERWTNLNTSGTVTLIESSKDHAIRATHGPY
jgi:enediyne biosynthesis protein E4